MPSKYDPLWDAARQSVKSYVCRVFCDRFCVHGRRLATEVQHMVHRNCTLTRFMNSYLQAKT